MVIGAVLSTIVRMSYLRDSGRLVEVAASSVLTGFVVGAASFLPRLRERVELHPEGLLVCMFVGGGLTPWSDITSVTVRSGPLGRTVRVVGRHGTVRMPLPYDARLLPDPDFDAKTAALIDRWERWRDRA